MKEFVGVVATICTTSANIPQIVSLYRTKSAKDVSLATYCTLLVGMTLWTVYGILCQDIVLITANVISLSLVCTVIVMKVRYDNLWKTNTETRQLVQVNIRRSDTSLT